MLDGLFRFAEPFIDLATPEMRKGQVYQLEEGSLRDMVILAERLPVPFQLMQELRSRETLVRLRIKGRCCRLPIPRG